MGKTTLVLGASLKAERYGNMAVRRLRAMGHPVVAVGGRDGFIGDVEVTREIPEGAAPHTVTLYMNAQNQGPWEERILALHPARIIFNPGAENPALASRAQALRIEGVDGCTLVMLGSGQF
ncbi:MAG TPA: CoA-binding protein [Flavobacteriales bacterium]|nr:CoA-binding protein [Flavobacteriales bacterium]